MSDSPVSINVDVNRLIDQTVEYAKSLAKHLSFLVSMPTLAYQQLDEVLGEIDKCFTAVDDVVQEHLRVSLSPSLIDTDANLLIRLSGPELPQRIEKDRGHCHVIARIYSDYLCGIFERLLDKQEQKRDEVRRIFITLGYADNELFKQFGIVGKSLQERAKEVLRLQLNGDVDGAKTLLKKDAAKLIELRQHLQDAHQQLTTIKNNFIKAMVPPV